MTWRLASSLLTLRNQVNVHSPTRNKASDGTIGDQAHAAGKSDHNPDRDGVVRAIDITHDPEHGVHTKHLAEALRQSRDPRIAYVVSHGEIFSSTVQPWVWRKYTGKHPHTSHVHISVAMSKALYDDPSPWDLKFS